MIRKSNNHYHFEWTHLFSFDVGQSVLYGKHFDLNGLAVFSFILNLVRKTGKQVRKIYRWQGGERISLKHYPRIDSPHFNLIRKDPGR